MGNYIYNKIVNCIYDSELANSSNDIPLYSLDGKILNCKIVDIYDGDTCTAVIRINKKQLQKYKVRMMGYDSPEMKPHLNVKNRDKEKEDAKKAKNALQKKVSNNNDIKKNTKIIKIHCHKWDKYGRLLGTLYSNSTNINKWMIDNNYGYKYEGGSKKKNI